MSGPIQVDYAKLQQCEDAVDTSEKTLNTKLEAVEAQVAKLGNTWTGDGATAYRQAADKVNQAQGELAQTLAKIKITIADTNARYQQGEKDVTGMF
jgi:WXG100 family type VII secretion target